MRTVGLLPLSLLVLQPVYAQLSLPDTPYTPPDASAGTDTANGTTPNSQWSDLLGNLLYFYDEQRSGKFPSNKRVSWRNDSALDDGSDVGLDLTGGFYDAGGTSTPRSRHPNSTLTSTDYVKYTFPLSFTLMSICWGALDAGQGPSAIRVQTFPAKQWRTGYELAKQAAYLDDTIRWGLDWLIKVLRFAFASICNL